MDLLLETINSMGEKIIRSLGGSFTEVFPEDATMLDEWAPANKATKSAILFGSRREKVSGICLWLREDRRTDGAEAEEQVSDRFKPGQFVDLNT